MEAAKEGEVPPDTPVASSSTKLAGAAPSGQQGVLWFANIYPTKAFRFDIRQMLTHHNHETLIPKLLPQGVEVLQMVPREREGGAFVYFRAPPAFVLQVLRNLAKQDSADAAKDDMKQRWVRKEDILGKVCTGISQYLRTHEVRAFLSSHPVRAHRVEGQPYLEDLQARYPSSRLRIKIEPSGTKIPEELIYARLRRYGQLDDLEALPDGGFVAAYRYTAGAVAARNCLHQAKLQEAVADETTGGSSSSTQAPKLRIEFEPLMQKWLREAIVNNARYSIPLFVFLMLGTTYIIWDPMRVFSVQLRIAAVSAQDSSSEEVKPLQSLSGVRGLFLQAWGRWNQAQAQLLAKTRRSRSAHHGLLKDFWADRDQEVQELQQWLSQPQDRVMLLTGHRGNGQTAFVKEVLGTRAVVINVTTMLEAGGSADDQVFLRSMGRAFGYWPAQGMDRQMTALLDLLLPGSGKLSRENEVLVAVQRILSCVTWALVGWRQMVSKSTGAEAKAAPLFIIDGFTSENKDRREGFFNSLVNWAAYVSEARLGRVLFICDSSFGEPSILAALGDRPERLEVQQLKDADKTSVRRILERHCASALTDEELAAVGGRFRDISALVAHVEEGCPPHEAVRKLIDASEFTVRTLLMTGQPGVKWTRPQLWRAVRLLAGSDATVGVPYDVFLWSVFRGDESALRSMKESNLISVVGKGVDPIESRTRPSAGSSSSPTLAQAAKQFQVMPGSPLHAVVYRRLVQFEGLAAVLDMEVAKEDIKREQATLDTYEAELSRLQEVDDVKLWKGRALTDSSKALDKRKAQLLEHILEQHNKLEKYHEARRKAQDALHKRADEFKRGTRPSSSSVQETGATRGGLFHLLGLA